MRTESHNRVLILAPFAVIFLVALALLPALSLDEKITSMLPADDPAVANYRFANWISRLIRLPKTLTVDLLDATLQSVSAVAKGEDTSADLPTSINSLSPGNRRIRPNGTGDAADQSEEEQD